jgi:hypothetical protein
MRGLHLLVVCGLKGEVLNMEGKGWGRNEGEGYGLEEWKERANCFEMKVRAGQVALESFAWRWKV